MFLTGFLVDTFVCVFIGSIFVSKYDLITAFPSAPTNYESVLEQCTR
uniref:Uncharacterized protein n=1 Tax=Rhizophora mucronata TaxID=61149 RepID=A0A2P2N3X2_RHIMU